MKRCIKKKCNEVVANLFTRCVSVMCVLCVCNIRVNILHCVFVYLQVFDHPVAGSFKAPRIKGWSVLTSGELLTWMGITLKIGCLGRSRVSHYWSEVSGFGDATIRSAMTKNRYFES